MNNTQLDRLEIKLQQYCRNARYCTLTRNKRRFDYWSTLAYKTGLKINRISGSNNYIGTDEPDF